MVITATSLSDRPQAGRCAYGLAAAPVLIPALAIVAGLALTAALRRARHPDRGIDEA